MNFDPKKLANIDPVYNQPVNRLMLAINCYMSTGDHLGEGFAVPVGNSMKVLLPVNNFMDQDKNDFQALKSKFDSIKDDFDLKIENEGSQGLFTMYSFLVDEKQLDELAVELASRPGPAGWGSMKKTVDQFLK